MKSKHLKPILAALLLLCSSTIYAFDFESEGVFYNIHSHEKKSAKVTHAGNSAEHYCGQVVIPATVTHQGITYNVTGIEPETFWVCTELTAITLPGSVEIIDSYTFYNCTALAEIVVSKGTTAIGTAAFSECTKLTSITLPESIKAIAADAFSGCTSLTSITLPNELENIDAFTFKGCTELATITLPKNLNNIGDAAFFGCTKLKSITLPKELATIGSSAFEGCTALTKITIPANTTTIEKHAFNGCSALTEIVVESGNPVYDSRNHSDAIIEKATDRLVQGCKETAIPQSVTIIGEWAFYGCEGLKIITIPTDCITEIEEWAFLNCTGLKDIKLPGDITKIGDGAFYGCTGLTEISSRATNPPTIGTYTFDGLYSRAILYVPVETREYYRTAPYWKNFTNIEERAILGDVNKDDTVDIADITTLVAMILDPSMLTPDGDVDCDGMVDIADITMLVSIILGN